MITAEDKFEKYKNNTALTEGHYEYLIDKEDFIQACKEFTNLHLDAAIKEWSEHLFRHNIEVETPMNYEDWLRHYKNRNKLN